MGPLALEGVHVLDLSQIMAGPFCGMLLADMGADVVKVEKPGGGDDSRRMGPPFLSGESVAFLAMNRNKRGIVVDLKKPEGQALLRRLASRADVLVEGFRPGTLEELGLGCERMLSERPELIYCSISGFGQTGPYRERGGFDLVAQGMSGLMSVTGHPGQPPVKVGVPIADLNAGMYAAYGVLCAYIHRLRTGKGQLVDTSLFEAGIAYTIWESAQYFATGEAPRPMGSAHRLSAPYQAFPTADGHLTVGGANQSTWEKLCRALEREDLALDPRFRDNASRTTRAAELAAELGKIFSARPTAEWLARLEAAGVPAGPLHDMPAVYADPQARARGMMVEIDHPKAGRVKNIGLPVKLSGTPGAIRRPAPTLGQHTDEVLREAGLAAGEISELRRSGAVA